jgi:hypothetical protein
MAYFRNREKGNVIEAFEFSGSYESWRAIAASGVSCCWCPGCGDPDDPPFVYLDRDARVRAGVGDFVVRRPGKAAAAVLTGDDLRARYVAA